MYDSDLSPEKHINVQTLASFRHLFPSLAPVIKDSPHSCLSLLPTSPLSVASIQSSSLHELAQMHSLARHAFSEYDVNQMFNQLTSTGLPTEESIPAVPLVISNASPWRLIEVDWSSAGATETICGYRKLRDYEKKGIDAIQMIGRLADGSVLLDTVLSERHAELLRMGADHLSSNESP